MNSAQKDKVTKIAKKVLPKIKKYAEQNRFNSDLCGCCSFASGVLLDELSKISSIKVKAVIVEDLGEYHIYIQINKDFILDITSKQFNPKNKAIVLIKRTTINNLPWYWKSSRKAYASRKKLIEFLKKDKWNNEQIPFDKFISKL